MKSERLAQERLKESLSYNPDTGIFKRKIHAGNHGAKKGDIAGSKNADGYLVIRIDNKPYLAHRLAWLHYYGAWPSTGLDHEDRVRHHNWIDNLREAGQQCNMRNCGNFKHNKSGVKGVYRDQKYQKWRAQICVNEKTFYLGAYKAFHNAACARLAAEQCLGWSGCDSSSPAFKYVQEMLNI